MQSITLDAEQKRILVDHANKESPNEACAILFGGKHSNNIIISDICLAENILKSPNRFEISHEQLLDIYSNKKTEPVGIFHSHPHSEAYPSETDKEFMDINPVVWVIYSVIDMKFRAFVLDEGILEIDIV